jgi:hypothetical protein
MKLTDEQKKLNRFNRLLETAKTKQLGTYTGIVAKDFQEMIRAEAGAFVGKVDVVINGCTIAKVFTPLGDAACVTCGNVLPWRGSNHLDTGHCVAGRAASIVLEETNVHPQCVSCNKYKSGNQEAYIVYMAYRYGYREVERLQRLKNTARQWTREQLVWKKIEFLDRIKAAKEVMKHG